MNVRLDVFHHIESGRADLKLDQILALVHQLTVQGGQLMQELDTLTAKVEETTTVEQSAIELLNGLSAQITALKADPVQLQALADSLGAKSSELAAAITANTPSA